MALTLVCTVRGSTTKTTPRAHHEVHGDVEGVAVVVIGVLVGPVRSWAVGLRGIPPPELTQPSMPLAEKASRL